MKFSNGCWMQKEGIESFFPAQVYFIKKEDGQPAEAGKFACHELTICAPTHKINHRGDTLGGVNLTLRISAPVPEVLRIKVDHYLGVRPKAPEYELNTDIDNKLWLRIKKITW